MKWLRDNLGIISSAPEVSDLASSVADTSGVYFVPAFSGLYAPYWRDDARGYVVIRNIFYFLIDNIYISLSILIFII